MVGLGQVAAEVVKRLRDQPILAEVGPRRQPAVDLMGKGAQPHAVAPRQGDVAQE